MAADPSLTYVEYITFKYDNSGNLIEYESTSGTDSKPTIKQVHSYDSHGNQIKSESYSYGELVYSFERKFDSMGNYTEVVAYDDCGVPFLMEEYIFTYRH